MLRILIVATLLFLVSATAVEAGSAVASGEGARTLQIGARASAQAVLQPAIRASMATRAMYRSINGSRTQRAAGNNAMLALFHGGGDKPGLALPVSDSLSLDLRYQYLRPEDIRRETGETASLDEAYTSHNVVLRARWQF